MATEKEEGPFLQRETRGSGYKLLQRVLLGNEETFHNENNLE